MLEGKAMMKSLVVLATGLVWTGISVASSYDLVRASSLTAGSWTRSVAIGDVTGDGLDDIVLGTDFRPEDPSNYLVLIYPQKVDGGLGDPLKFKYAERGDHYRYYPDIKLGDVDKNGIMDVVVGHAGGVTFLRSDGGERFLRSTIETSIDSVSTNIRLLDINFDGNMDVIALYYYEGGVALFGDGRGGVIEERSIASNAQSYKDLVVDDVTGDGSPDLVVVWAGGLYVYPHDGVDGFRKGVKYEVPGFSPASEAVAVGDFNGDGWNDIAVSDASNNPRAAVWLYSGSSMGVLDTPTKLETLDIPRALISADLDHDGRMDLLVGHDGWGAVGRYMQGEDGFAPEALTGTVSSDDPRALAVGDWNDDGCMDAAVAGGVQGLLILLEGHNCVPARPVSDFDGDGRSDLFWHQGASGANAIWKGADYRNQQPVVQVTNPAWRVMGHGDFDGDRRSDVLWHNNATGAAAIWRSGDYRTQLPITRVTNPDWSIVGIGDFNGDAKDDVLWRDMRTGRNAIWKSGDYRDQQTIVGVTDQRWTVVAVDDFDGDRKDDIMWRHAGSGRNAIWKSGDYRTQQIVATVEDGDWQVAGTGDFNGDDESDVLWRHAVRGANALWYSADADSQALVGDMESDWIVASVGDHDGNRNSEIVWRNRSTGENLIWRSVNGSLEFPMTDVANPAWRVVP